MHSRAMFVAVVAVLTQLPCHAIECAKGEPADAATAFYAAYRDFIHGGVGSPPLSHSLAKLVKANITENLDTGDVGAIDWDFWTDAQDGEASQLAKATSVKNERGRKLVRLSYQFISSPGAKPVPKQSDLALIREQDGCWLVDDVVHKGRSVSRLLEAGTSSRGRKK